MLSCNQESPPMLIGYITVSFTALFSYLSWVGKRHRFQPLAKECDSRTLFRNRLTSQPAEKQTPISRLLFCWRFRLSPAKSCVSSAELMKLSFEIGWMESVGAVIIVYVFFSVCTFVSLSPSKIKMELKTISGVQTFYW